MIPAVNEAFTTNFTETTMPSKDFALDITNARVNGTIENMQELRQAIYFILNTERYEHLIYSWDYGVEFKDLIGQPYSYVIPELERRITEALLQDDRITAVDGFKFERNVGGSKKKMHVTFVVHTIFGTLESEVGVNV